jgi:hypothetical protein
MSTLSEEENDLPRMMGSKLDFNSTPTKSSTRTPLRERTLSSLPVQEPSYVESLGEDASNCLDDDEDSSNENWAVIGSGRSTMSAYGQKMANLDDMTMGKARTSHDWLKTPVKTPGRTSTVVLGSSSPIVMDERTLRDDHQATQGKGKTPRTTRKVRKLTTRKWDFADEDELSG